MSYNAGGFVAEDMNEARDSEDERNHRRTMDNTDRDAKQYSVQTGKHGKAARCALFPKRSGIYKVGKPDSL